MKLVLLTPSKGSVSVECKNMLLQLGALLQREGHHLATSDELTPGLLHHSRAVLLNRLAHAQCDRGLWLDADTHLEPSAILAAMRRPEEVITWAYPVRISFDVHYPPKSQRQSAKRILAQPYRVWTATPRMTGGYVTRSADGALVELLHSGFGAVLMSPRIARLMHDECGPHQFDWDRVALSSAFDHLPAPSPRHSEDVSFWRRYMSKGLRIWCDPEPYVTNGQSGGCFADEIRMREEQMPLLCAQSFYAS